MDEILLNRDEKREIWQRVHDVPATARMNGQPDWTPEYEAALCRAQLAKVWREIQKAGHYSLPIGIVQALKAAGEGK